MDDGEEHREHPDEARAQAEQREARRRAPRAPDHGVDERQRDEGLEPVRLQQHEAEDEDVPEMLDNDSDAEDEEFLQSVEREVMEENDENWDPNRKQEGGKADTLKAVPNDIEMKPTKINPVDIESLVRREIMVSLENAIRTGNFAAFVNLPVLEMVDELDKTVKKVTDIGAHDLAKLIKQMQFISITNVWKITRQNPQKPSEWCGS